MTDFLKTIQDDFNTTNIRGEKDDTILLLKSIFNKFDVQDTILDLGCGKAEYHKYLSEYTFVGIDTNVELTDTDNIYYNHDLNIYPYTCINNRFNTIISLDTIEHLYRPDLFLQNIYDNLLLKSGICILCFPNINCIDDKLMNINISVFNPKLKEITNNRWTGQHIRFFELNSFGELCDQIGFKILGLTGCNYYSSNIGKLIIDHFNNVFNIPIEHINRELGNIIPEVAPNCIFILQKE